MNIKARHYEPTDSVTGLPVWQGEAHFCHCGEPWPCDASVLLAKLKAVEELRDGLKKLLPREGTVNYETLRQLDRILEDE